MSKVARHEQAQKLVSIPYMLGGLSASTGSALPNTPRALSLPPAVANLSHYTLCTVLCCAAGTLVGDVGTHMAGHADVLSNASRKKFKSPP